MAQRHGRVNRRGEGPKAGIDVVYETDPDAKQEGKGYELARWATRDLIADAARQPVCDWDAERRDVSPAALGELMRNLTADERQAAFTPVPITPDATEILFDSWALTSIGKPLVDNPLPERLPVAEHLHGIEDDEHPDTHIAWRAEVTETGFVAGRPKGDRGRR